MNPRLDREAVALLEVMRATGAPQPYAVPVEKAREQMRAALVTRGDPLVIHEVRDFSLPTPYGELPMRLYRPSTGPLPVALFLHGGGWTLNDLDTHDRLCRRIAVRSGWLVAALDFRRAPEHKHPAALEDAQIAYRWLLDNAERIEGDRACMAIVGESSGGATAACLTLLLRDLGAQMPILQILAYPVTDLCDRWPSYQEHGSGYTLDSEFARWSMHNYLPAGYDPEDRYLLPLAARDLAGVAPTLVMTAEFDPLRDEGIEYVGRLRSAGVAVEHIHVQNQMHGFLLLDRALTEAGVLIDRLADALADRYSALSRRTID